jgi:NAD(P)-dependent dehydrogenase (short-subunit alcohol dehydrogenase family)
MAELRFDDRVAVITGAGRGMGRAHALLLASRGAKVVVNDLGGSIEGQGLDAGPAQGVVDEIKAAGGEGVANTDSVAALEGCKALIEQAMDTYGRIDILIHNAGNVRWGLLNEITYEDFNAVLDVHLRGAFHTVREAFPHMLKAKYGRVVLTSSIGGVYGIPGVVNYGVSKAGTLGLANIVAIEGAAANVKCNSILPGAMTRMAAGMDTSFYTEETMHPGMVSPLVGYLSHESCAISGEVLISMAGRVAQAYFAETVGVFHPAWTMEQISEELDAIRKKDPPVVFPQITGFEDHLHYCFDMAKRGLAAAKDA